MCRKQEPISDSWNITTSRVISYHLTRQERELRTSESYSDADAVQENFVQQRGFKDNKLGETNDIRELRKRGVIEDPITGPKEITKKSSSNGSSFYGDE